MSKLLYLAGATLGGALGWWAGAALGTMTAFILSCIGTGIGAYAGVRIARDLS